MRIVPVITAILVSATLYFIVLERDKLLEFAGIDLSTPAEEEAAASEDVAAVEEDVVEDTGAVAVQAMRSVARTIDSGVVLRGQTEAARQVDVQAETSGLVISEPLRKGAFVEAGQLLCELDPGTRMAILADAQARLAEATTRVPEGAARLIEAEARLDEAKINFNAADKLSGSGYASETRVASTQAAVRAAEAAVQSAKSGLEAAKAGIQSAEANVAAVEEDIKKLRITAPFDGLLETDTAELGSLMQANGPSGAVCATIIQLDPIKLVGFVPETEVARVRLGADAGARVTGGQTASGKVSFLSRSADQTTRTFRVEVSVPNADLSIRDGQTVDMLISAEGAMAHLLPQSSLTLNDEGQLGVRVVGDNSIAAFIPVQIVRDTVNGIFVTGLPEEVNVIVVGQEYVTDGVPVVATYQEATQ